MLRICALIWATNLYGLAQAAAHRGDSALMVIHVDDLLADPLPALAAVSAHFGYAASPEDLAAMTDPSVWQRNAKHPDRRLDRNLRRRQNEAVLAAHRGAVADAVDWIQPVIRESGLLEFLAKRRSSC